MRIAFLGFVGAAVLAIGLAAVGAVSIPTATATRSVTVSIVGDSAAYVAIAATSGGAHSCFVSEGADGKVALNFASATSCNANARGTGLNLGDGTTKFSTYAFHDLLTITNKGDKTVRVWANVTTQAASPNHVDVDLKSTTGQMTFSEYWSTSSTNVQLAIGSSAYLGVRVNATAASGSISGAISIDARG